MTKNAIDATKVAKETAETKRHNTATEKQAERDWDLKEASEWNKRHMNRISTLGNVAGAALGGAAGIAARMNDFSFYTKYGEAFTNLLNVSNTSYAGMPMALPQLFDRVDITNATIPSYLGTSTTLNTNDDLRMNKPSIFTFTFVPYIGDSGIGETPCSIAVRNFFSSIRAANSGVNQAYDSVDIFQVPLAADSILTVLGWLERGIRLASLVNPRDISTKEYALLAAHCFNQNTWVQNFIHRRADLLSIYNTAVLQYNALNIPFEMDFIRRHVWLSASLFKHRDSTGSYYYLFNPEIYWVYDEANAKLKANSFQSALGSGTNIYTIRTILTSMLNALLDSQTVAVMSGDMLRAFPNSSTNIGLLDMNVIVDGYKGLNTVTDIKYLQSIKNMTISKWKTLSELDVNQAVVNNTPYLYMGTWSGSSWTAIELNPVNTAWRLPASMARADVPSTTVTNYTVRDSGKLSSLIDYYDTTITPEDQCYNLSFTHIPYAGHLYNARSEFITSMNVSTVNLTAAGKISSVTQTLFNSNYAFVSYDTTMPTVPGMGVENVQILALEKLALVDFVPKLVLVYLQQIDPSGNMSIAYKIFWSRNVNRRFISEDLIDKTQEQALISMFTMTSKGSAQRVKSNRKGRK